jgi:hypothetical protein
MHLIVQLNAAAKSRSVAPRYGEAQRKSVSDYLKGGAWELVGEFTEVESGKKSDRSELRMAIEACRKEARLVIAKLDRLSRNRPKKRSRVGVGGFRNFFNGLLMRIGRLTSQSRHRNAPSPLNRIVATASRQALLIAKGLLSSETRHDPYFVRQALHAHLDQTLDLNPWRETVRSTP